MVTFEANSATVLNIKYILYKYIYVVSHQNIVTLKTHILFSIADQYVISSYFGNSTVK